ncbi:MAG: bifunctional nuclease family protein [Bacteroidales bacterium]|jgi:bifunctional DNase/RNase|nr:bifunctional nuclease family protein [Bacteroidales bacterium]
MIRLVFKEIISSDKSDDAAILILKEFSGERELPITITIQAAENINLVINGNRNIRPDIYDSFCEFVQKSFCKLDYVYIHKYEYGLFYCYMYFFDKDGNQLIIEQARPSDALIIAFKYHADIFCEDIVLEEVASELPKGFINKILFSDDTAGLSTNDRTDDIIVDEFGNAEKLSKLSLEEINIRLDLALKNENYKYAAKLRDARNKKL